MTEPVAPFPVSVVGIGNMGGAMAQRLLGLGWPVQVCDVRPERLQLFAPFGAVGHVLPDVAAMNSVVCIVAVVDAAQTEAVLFGPHGLAPAMPVGSVVMLSPGAWSSLACTRWMRRCRADRCAPWTAA